jgi:hypothetical protein
MAEGIGTREKAGSTLLAWRYLDAEDIRIELWREPPAGEPSIGAPSHLHDLGLRG